MKKIMTLLLSAALLLTGCGSTASVGASSAVSATSQSEATPDAAASEAVSTETVETTVPASSAAESEAATDETEGSKAIVVYFSWSGNTESVAGEIAAQTGADVFRLEPATPYTDDYDTLLDIAQAEQSENARPEIAGSIENFEDYDTVYLGFPNWWGNMPMILYSFLDEYDLAGKTLVPFVTSGGSGFSNTISEMTALEPEATILDGLSLGSSEAAQPQDAVTNWLTSLGLAQ